MSQHGSALRNFQQAYNYTPRPSQDEMFQRCERRFAGRHRIVGVEAPTGTGKSMHLVSRLLTVQQRDDFKRIVVATYTRSQADHYRELAEQAVEYGLAESWNVLYGSSEYLCPKRRASCGLDPVPVGDSDGSRAGLARIGLEFPDSEWTLSAHHSDDCDEDDCYDYYYAARDKAASSSRSIVLMTQTRVAVEFLIGNTIFEFGEGDHLIIDEAHNFPGVLRESFGATITNKKMNLLVRPKDGPVGADLAEAVHVIREFFQHLHLAEGQEYTQVADRSAFAAALDLLENCRVQSRRRENALLLRRRELALLADTGKHAFVRHGKHLEACVADLDVQKNVRRVSGLFETVLLMSATLVGMPVEDMGLDCPVTVRSAFDLRKNRVLTTRSGPNTEEERVKDLVDLVRDNCGRALIICKSSGVRYQGLREPQHLLYARLLAEAGLRVGLQVKSSDVPRLRQSLLDGEVDVVVGLASVREGFDVPGDALSLVVLAQLPWPYMADPILAARIHTDGDQWRIPQAEMELNTRQAVGRLCRTPSDTGIVALLDSRPNAIRRFLRLAQMDINDAVA